MQNHPGLRKYVLHKVEWTGVKLGAGSFGRVEEVKMAGTVCAGKIWHDILLNPNNEGVENMIQRFIKECELMSQVHHPNIVQFMGMCFMPNSPYPILVMEKLDTSLDSLLVTGRNLPMGLKLHILLDVSSGLVHLHNNMQPPIVHRDLTTCNVLLNQDSLKAKIADLGNARMIEPGKLSKTLSNSPGTQVYMPPEAAGDNPSYDSSLDVFSFGHLALYTITEVFPGSLLPATYTDPNTYRLFPRSELERRRQYIEILHSRIDKTHALVVMIEQCLNNVPKLR
jgi:serine/threonine protein kinase